MEMKIEQNNHAKYDATLEDLYIADLEKEWQKRILKHSEKGWLQIFPEAKTTVKKLIGELEQEKSGLWESVKKELILVRQKTTNEFPQWFWREWVKYSKVPKLIEIERRLIKFKMALSKDKRVVSGEKDRITGDDIYQSSQIPITDIASPYLEQLRQVGENYVTLCPFHQETHPSFYIYPKTNSFYCYGCQAGGNVINFVMKLYNLPFKEAIQFLLRGQI